MPELHLFSLPTELFFFSGGEDSTLSAVFFSLKNCLALCRFLGITQNCLLQVKVKRQWQHFCCFFILPWLGTAAFVVSQTVVHRFLMVYYGLIGVVMLSPFVFVWQIALQNFFKNTH